MEQRRKRMHGSSRWTVGLGHPAPSCSAPKTRQPRSNLVAGRPMALPARDAVTSP